MDRRTPTQALFAAVLVVLASAASPAHAFDAARAQMLARQSGCFKCHAVDHAKDAPAYQDIAAKYRGKADAAARMVHHITSGEQVKFADGHSEDHKVIKSRDPAEIGNLVEWILSLEGGKPI